MSCGPSTGFFFLLFFFVCYRPLLLCTNHERYQLRVGFFCVSSGSIKQQFEDEKKNILHTDDILIVSYILCKTIHFCVCVWCAYDHTNETDLRSLDSAVFFVLWYFSAASLLFSFMIMVWKKITLANSQFETK